MYELSYLISGTVAEANVEKVAQAVEKEIKKINGEIINQVSPTKRKLSYPINKQGFAYFATLYFEAPKNDFKELNQYFKLNDEILRHLIVESTESAMHDYLRRQKPEETKKQEELPESSPLEIKAESSLEVKEKGQASKISPSSNKATPETLEAVEKEEATKQEAPVQEEVISQPKENPKKKINLEDIDKKIDEILNNTEL